MNLLRSVRQDSGRRRPRHSLFCTQHPHSHQDHNTKTTMMMVNDNGNDNDDVVVVDHYNNTASLPVVENETLMSSSLPVGREEEEEVEEDLLHMRLQVLDFVETSNLRRYSYNQQQQQQQQQRQRNSVVEEDKAAEEEDGHHREEEEEEEDDDTPSPELTSMRARVQARIDASRNATTRITSSRSRSRTLADDDDDIDNDVDVEVQPPPISISILEAVLVVEDDEDGGEVSDRNHNNNNHSTTTSTLTNPPPTITSSSSQQQQQQQQQEINTNTDELLLVSAIQENLCSKLLDHRLQIIWKILFLLIITLSLALVGVTRRQQKQKSNNSNSSTTITTSSSTDNPTTAPTLGIGNDDSIIDDDSSEDNSSSSSSSIPSPSPSSLTINHQNNPTTTTTNSILLHESCGTMGRWKQVDYRGTINTTRTGRTCHVWDNAPSTWSYMNSISFPNAGLDGPNNNYCRNPEPNSRHKYAFAWCIVDNLANISAGWEYCDIPSCGFCGYSNQNSTTITIDTNDTDTEMDTTTTTNNNNASDCTQTCFHDSDCHNHNDDTTSTSATTKSVSCLFDTKCHLWRNGIDYPNSPGISTICGDRSISQSNYRGSINVTSKGYPCHYWSQNLIPHRHLTTPEHYPYSGLENNNYCRNPTGQGTRAWCYTQDPNVEWAYCTVPFC